MRLLRRAREQLARSSRLLGVLALFGWVVPASAEDQILMELDLAGRIAIEPDGRVHSHEIDQALPASISTAIGSLVSAWRFEPILESGRPVRASTRMRLTVVALERGSDRVRLEIRNAYFGEALDTSGLVTPVYPSTAMEHAVEARVILAIKVDDQGQVLEAHPYQISFRKGLSERLARRTRRLFIQASLAAARASRYPAGLAPPQGRFVLQPFSFEFQPFDDLAGHQVARVWIPGPITVPPGFDAQADAEASAASGGDESFVVDHRFRLSEPNGESTPH